MMAAGVVIQLLMYVKYPALVDVETDYVSGKIANLVVIWLFWW